MRSDFFTDENIKGYVTNKLTDATRPSSREWGSGSGAPKTHIGIYDMKRESGYMSLKVKYNYWEGSLTENTTLSGNVTIGSDLTVPQGITLTIASGTTVTLLDDTKLKVIGTLAANGVTFQGSGSPGSWNSISFYSGSTGSIQNSTIRDAECGVYCNGATVTLSNVEITNSSTYGVSVLQNSNVTISGCNISNNTTGVRLYCNTELTGNTISNNTNYGIQADNISGIYWDDNTLEGNGYAMFLNNSSAGIGNSTFSNNDHGIVINSSAASFEYSAITCNTAVPNFRAQNYSTINMGDANQDGNNSIFGSEMPDLEAMNNTVVLAFGNYWGSPYPGNICRWYFIH